MLAELWNLIARSSWIAGTWLRRAGLELCGLSGWFDAKADSAGYWDRHTASEKEN